MFRKFKRRIKIIFKLIGRITLPGFDNTPLFEVMSFFIKGIRNGAITTRASSIAFNFFIAVFPALIFLFTLIPYIPFPNFQTELLNLSKDIIPSGAFEGVLDTIEDLITRKRTDLLSSGFILALIFSTNGISSLIDAFNATYHSVENRRWLNKWLISVALVFIFSILVITATILIIFSGMGIDYLVTNELLQSKFTILLLMIGKWLIVITLFLVAISFLYYFAPARKEKWKFFTPGSITATCFVILTSLIFSFFINNFVSYNKFYGSIWTVIVVLLWMYFNAIALIIGFELNASISNARTNNKKQ